MKSCKQFKTNLLKDKSIERAYEKLGPEFVLVEMIIKERLKRGLTRY